MEERRGEIARQDVRRAVAQDRVDVLRVKRAPPALAEPALRLDDLLAIHRVRRCPADPRGNHA